MSIINAKNSLVKQVETQIEQRLKAGVREPFEKIVIAGMKYALKGAGGNLMDQLDDSKDPLTDIVKGAIGIVGALRRAAKGAMPVDALVPAAMVLVLHGLDYAERAGLLKVDKATIDQATQLFIETITPLLGLPPEKLTQLVGQAHATMADQDKMAKLQMGAK